LQGLSMSLMGVVGADVVGKIKIAARKANAVANQRPCRRR
jgi:hypothetical protein